MPIVPLCGRLREEQHESRRFPTSLGNIGNHPLLLKMAGMLQLSDHGFFVCSFVFIF
jgi:hypothetical protein